MQISQLLREFKLTSSARIGCHLRGYIWLGFREESNNDNFTAVLNEYKSIHNIKLQSKYEFKVSGYSFVKGKSRQHNIVY